MKKRDDVEYGEETYEMALNSVNAHEWWYADGSPRKLTPEETDDLAHQLANQIAGTEDDFFFMQDHERPPKPR